MNNLPKGWRFNDTPSHGYLFPSEQHNENVPEPLRRWAGGYEEDCEWSIPVCFNPELWEEEVLKHAVKSFMDWYPQEFEKYFKTEIPKGSSYIKDARTERLENIGKFEKTAGFGDWHFGVPIGFVRATLRKVTEKDCDYKNIIGRPSGDEIDVLIPSEEYNAQRFFDPAKYQRFFPADGTDGFYTWDAYTKSTGLPRFV